MDHARLQSTFRPTREPGRRTTRRIQTSLEMLLRKPFLPCVYFQLSQHARCWWANKEKKLREIRGRSYTSLRETKNLMDFKWRENSHKERCDISWSCNETTDSREQQPKMLNGIYMYRCLHICQSHAENLIPCTNSSKETMIVRFERTWARKYNRPSRLPSRGARPGKMIRHEIIHEIIRGIMCRNNKPEIRKKSSLPVNYLTFNPPPTLHTTERERSLQIDSARLSSSQKSVYAHILRTCMCIYILQSL